MTEVKNLAIELRQLSRNFGEVEAIKSVDLDIKRGELFGLIGPDGAGKTTLLRTLAGLLKISQGEGSVAGIDLNQNPERIKPKIGYMAQQFGLYAELNVVENLRFFSDVFDVPREVFSERMDFLLSFAGLTEFRSRRADRLSGGMQKKLALACCLIHEPEILLLDEPTTGVDPISRREFWRILGDLHLDGTTILVSTPYMDEADRCSRVGLIYEGELIRCNSPESIRQSIEGEMLVLEIDASEGSIHQLDMIPGVMEVQVYGDKYHLLVENAKKQQKEIKKYFKRRKIEIRSLYRSMPKMEEAFISIISHLE